MNHSEHDFDLLASWASGYEPDRRRAEEFMTQCPECAAFFTEQSQVRSQLGRMGTTSLRPEEATALLAALATVEAVPAAMPQRTKPISPVWNRLLGAAAALALVTAIGIAFRPTGSGGEAPNAAAGAASDARAESALEMQADTTMAAPATTAATFGAAADMGGDLDALKAEADALAADPPEDSDSTQRLVSSCPSLEGEILASIETTYQGRETFLVLVEDKDTTVVKAYFGDDCAEIDLG